MEITSSLEDSQEISVQIFPSTARGSVRFPVTEEAVSPSAKMLSKVT